MPLERWLQADAHDAIIVSAALGPPASIGRGIEAPAAIVGIAAGAALRGDVSLIALDPEKSRRNGAMRLVWRQAIRHLC